MIDVSNGRLRSTTHNPNGTTTYEWFVTEPINNYGIEVNAGQYAHFSDTFNGEKGALTLDFWPLAYHVDTAKVQFQQAKSMLACFEHWFGPYPWYADGYKLIEAPHLGMEHQSGVAYGNHFKNGYLGRDLSGTGLGLNWDFIIVHESAHEWWGNNISAKDHADMWIHESFANYAEGIYTECQDGKAAGAAYIIGSRRNIKNDAPIIPARGVNAEGSNDMYYKGGSMLHMIRQLVRRRREVARHPARPPVDLPAPDRDRPADRGLHQQAVRHSISRRCSPQYLTTTKIPVLEYKIDWRQARRYRWANVVPGFAVRSRSRSATRRASTGSSRRRVADAGAAGRRRFAREGRSGTSTSSSNRRMV